MELDCEVLIDYLNVARKPTRPKKTVVILERDEFRNLVLRIGKQKAQQKFFKLEDISKIYPPNGSAPDKVGFEFTLPGGTMVNVMLQKAEPLERLKPFLDICQKIYEDPNNSYMIELEAQD